MHVFRSTLGPSTIHPECVRRKHSNGFKLPGQTNTEYLVNQTGLGRWAPSDITLMTPGMASMPGNRGETTLAPRIDVNENENDPGLVPGVASPNRQADKIKNLLARYYDDGDEAGVLGGAAGAGKDAAARADPSDGAEEIQPMSAVSTSSSTPSSPKTDLISQIQSNQRLDDLLTTERELATDIGNADIELRGVVYDSYCSFMQAAETVKDLHAALHEVDASLHTLDALLSSVAENSQGIDDRLTAQQRVIFDMHEKRQVVQGVEALLRVDERMREEMDAGEYEQVVRLYAASRDALAAYERHDGVGQLRGRVETIREELVAVLRDRMDRNAMGMLVGLGEADGDGGALVDSYLASRRAVLASEKDVGEKEKNAWALVEETAAVCREVLRGYDGDGDGRSGPGPAAVDVFVSEVVGDIVREAVGGAIEEDLEVLAAAGGFDASGAEHVDHGDHMEHVDYGAGNGLPALFAVCDRMLLRSAQVDDARGTCDSDASGRDGHPRPATSVTRRVILGALDRHVRAAYAVVGARAFRSMKEMMMRLLLSEGADARFLKVLIKSLEVTVKQDFGLVEKVVEAWVVWDGCVTKAEVLECLDDGCRGMLASLCDGCAAMVAGETTSPASPTLARSPTLRTSPAASSGFLDRQFIVPTTLSRMHEAAPVASLCLASALSKVRGAVVDAEMHETAVAPVVESLTSRYIERMTHELSAAVSASFERDVIGQTDSPPTAPSQAASDIVRLVTQVETDRVNTNWTDGLWAKELLSTAIEQEMRVAERRRLTKAAFQQLQADVAVVRRRLGATVDATVLDTVVSRAAEWCDEPALVDPLVLERLCE